MSREPGRVPLRDAEEGKFALSATQALGSSLMAYTRNEFQRFTNKKDRSRNLYIFAKHDGWLVYPRSLEGRSGPWCERCQGIASSMSNPSFCT
eukprot:5058697-Pleurochrysis_carterae.AAC.2